MHSYIASLLGNTDHAWEVLQETNQVLIQKQDEFIHGTSFINWALTVAQFQTMAWLRDQKRDRHILTPEIAEQMVADRNHFEMFNTNKRIEALDECIGRLSQDNRGLLHARYALSETLEEIQERTGRKANALKQIFFRLRKSLAKCVEDQMGLQ